MLKAYLTSFLQWAGLQDPPSDVGYVSYALSFIHAHWLLAIVISICIVVLPVILCVRKSPDATLDIAKDESQERMRSGVSSLSDSDEGDSGGEDHECSTIKAKRIDSLHVGDVEHQENHYHMTKVCGPVGICTFSQDLKKLSPLSGGEHMQERRKRGFCGRSWVYAEMRAWFQRSVSGDGEEGSGPVGKYEEKAVLLVTGGPGVGKSALAAQLEGDGSDEFRECDAFGGRLLAVHSIQVYDEASKSANAFVKGITGAFLRFCAQEKIMDTTQFERELEQHDYFNAHERWCHLMKWMKKANVKHPLTIVVNGLDEGEDKRKESIASVLGRMQHTKLIPDWLRIVAFTRPHKNILAYFNKCYDEISLNADSEEFGDSVLKDAEEYVSKCGLDDVKKATLEKLAKAARGNFLVLSYLKRALEESRKEGEALIEELTHLPADRCGEDDLVFILYHSFERFVKRSIEAGKEDSEEVLQKAYSPFVPLLSVLVAAEGKLTDEQLFQAVRVVEPEFTWDRHRKRLKDIGWLLTKDSHGRRSFFHGYVSEWLRCKDRKAGTEDGIEEDPSNKYRVYAEDGHALLAAWGLLLCGGGAWKEEKYGGHPGLEETEQEKLEVMVGRWIASKKLEKEELTRLVVEGDVASCSDLVDWDRKKRHRARYDGTHIRVEYEDCGFFDMRKVCIERIGNSEIGSEVDCGLLLRASQMKLDTFLWEKSVFGILCAFAEEGNGKCIRMCIHGGGNVDERGPGGLTPSMFAARKGDMDALKWLHENANAKLKLKDDEGRAIWIHATASRSLRLVKYVLKSCSKRESTVFAPVLLNGAHHGSIEIVQWAAELAAKNGIEPGSVVERVYKQNALMIAVQAGHCEIARWLGSKEGGGIDLNLLDNDGKSALELAIKGRRCGIDIAEWLLRSASPQQKADALNCAIEVKEHQRMIDYLYDFPIGRTSVLEWLLEESEKRVDPSIAGRGGIVPLMKAIECEDLETVKMLLEMKANVCAKDEKGKSVLMWAACQRPRDEPCDDTSPTIVDVLLNDMAPVEMNVLDKEGKSALYYAVDVAHMSNVNALVMNGADLRLRYGEKKRTALMIALNKAYRKCIAVWNVSGDEAEDMCESEDYRWRYMNIAECLANNMTADDILCADGDGNTALMFSARSGDCMVLKILLEHESVVSALKQRNHSGDTAFENAVKHLRPSCARILAKGETVDADKASELLLTHDALRNLDTAKWLVERGASIHFEKEDWTTPWEVVQNGDTRYESVWEFFSAIQSESRNDESIVKKEAK